MHLRLNTQSRMFRSSCLLFACLIVPAAAQSGAADPKDAIGWFQRASEQMDLRAPGATPFHMKVAFNALPGFELLGKKKTPQIMAGEGIYEETWISLHQWRREVTLGDYHAVEVASNKMRKMQASSDYEPSRVLMLLDALLSPVTRDFTSRSLNKNDHFNWEIKHKSVGDLGYVLITLVEDDVPEFRDDYVFLPNGLLVQSNGSGLTTNWQNHAIFAGRVFPRHLVIQAGGHDRLTAEIVLEVAGKVDPAIFELPGEEADAGMTLRPLHYSEVRFHYPPETCTSMMEDSSLFPLYIRWIIDRHGVVHDVELLDSPNLDAKTRSIGLTYHLDCLRNRKMHPATIDSSPAELATVPLLLHRHQ